MHSKPCIGMFENITLIAEAAQHRKMMNISVYVYIEELSGSVHEDPSFIRSIAKPIAY